MVQMEKNRFFLGQWREIYTSSTGGFFGARFGLAFCLTEEVLAAWLGVKNAATTRCFWCRNGMILSEASLPVAMALNRSVIPERGLYIALAIIFLQIFLEPAWWKSSIMRETLDHQRMWREVNSLPSKVLSIWDLNDLFANVILPNFFEPNLSHSKELLRPTGNTRKANRIVWGCTEPLCWLTGDGAEPWKTLLGFFFGSNPSLEHQAEGSAVCSGFRSDQKSAPTLEDLRFLYFFFGRFDFWDAEWKIKPIPSVVHQVMWRVNDVQARD